MPLINIYYRQQCAGAARLMAALPKFHDFLISKPVFDVPRGALQLNLIECSHMYPSPAFYMSVRCKAKPERTKEMLDGVIADVSQELADNYGIQGSIRLEKFQPELTQSYHAPDLF